MKKFLTFLLVFVLFLCSSCTDLGDPQTFEEYYNIIGDVSFVCQSDNPNPQIDQVSIQKLCNKENAEKVFSVMDQEVNYKYIAIPILVNTNLQDMAIWFKSEEFSGTLNLEMYLRSGFPSSFFGDMYVDKIEGKYEYARVKQGRDIYGNPTITIDYLDLYFDGYGTVTDENNNVASYTLSYDRGYPYVEFTFTYQQTVNNVVQNITRDYQCAFVTESGETDYNNITVVCTDRTTGQIVMRSTYKYKGISNPIPEAELTNKIGETTLGLYKDTWNSFELGKFVDEKGEYVNGVKASSGDYLFVKIVNNCAGAHRKNLNPLAFEINNVLLKTKKAEE